MLLIEFYAATYVVKSAFVVIEPSVASLTCLQYTGL